MWGRALVCLSVLPWPLASAAPWVQREGFAYARASIAAETLDQEPGWRSDAFLEYGVTDRWTATAKLETVTHPQVPQEDRFGGRVTLRGSIFENDVLSVTGEVGFIQGAAIGGRNGCDTPGMEWRGGAAASYRILARNAYVFGEMVRRDHEACLRDRVELGAGLELTQAVSASAQIWIEDGEPAAPSEKAQAELIWRRGDADYSLGYRKELGDAFEEESLFLAYALRF